MAAAAAWSVMARVELFGQALYYYGSDLLGMGGRVWVGVGLGLTGFRGGQG